MRWIVGFLVAFTGSTVASLAGPYYEAGTITDISSNESGVYFRYSAGNLPANCSGGAGGWFRIDAANAAMISILLSFYMAGKRDVVAYSPGLSTDNVCRVTTLDPVE